MLKKINKLLIGTNNKGKLREIRALLPDKIKTFSTSDFNLKSPRENGKTFLENSFIKSRYFSKKTGLICLADDSGLEIDLLEKRPGIYSARWGGKTSDFKKAIKKVYKELDKKNKNWREKKLKQDLFVLLQFPIMIKKLRVYLEKLKERFHQSQKVEMALGMIQYLFQKIKKKLLVN